MELMPRITRAQSMDALSSMATIAGYKAVLLAADTLPRMFPMLMTAAGTVAPARVFVIGAGVAGLQAIATARRLGAVVSGYDVRPAVQGAGGEPGRAFVVLELETAAAEDKGGYAEAMGEEFYRRQRELMAGRARASTTWSSPPPPCPARRRPCWSRAEMVRGMAPGSVIVDLAAERGGNCELTRPGETVVEGGVTILGPLNLPSTVPYHASQMYARNVATFLKHLIKDGELVARTWTTRSRARRWSRTRGEVVHPRVREALGRRSPRCPTRGDNDASQRYHRSLRVHAGGVPGLRGDPARVAAAAHAADVAHQRHLGHRGGGRDRDRRRDRTPPRSAECSASSPSPRP